MKSTIAALLESGEGQYVEFKSVFDRSGVSSKRRTNKALAKDIAICLAEFANSDGGTLILGVENDATVTGASFDSKTLNMLCEIAGHSWQQAVPYTVEVIPYEGHDLVVFSVDAQPDTYTLTDGRTPYRTNEQTTWLSQSDARRLKAGKRTTLVERERVPDATVKDLDPVLIERLRKKSGFAEDVSVEEMLTHYDLAIQNGSHVVLTMAACLLFGKPPMMRFHERCGITIRRFDGTTTLGGNQNNEIISRTLEKPLPVLIEETFGFMRDQIPVSSKLRNLFFEERPEYPTAAWQEAVVNAVAHRNYSYRGNDVEIRLFDDRMEIVSPGLPPEPVTIKELQDRQPVHASRNPRIMRVLKNLGFVRERGEGMPRIFGEMEQSHLPLPEVRSQGEFFSIVLRNTPIYDEATMTWLSQFPLSKLSITQRRALAHAHSGGREFFNLQDYVEINDIDKEAARREIRDLLVLEVVDKVGERRATRYFPRLQAGALEERLRDHFSRHEEISNSEYRKLAGGISMTTASGQLRKLVAEGILVRSGERRWSRYAPGPEFPNMSLP